MAERPYTPLGIDHVVLYVRDQDASRQFYCEQLGCTVDAVNEKAKIVHLRFGEQQIDIVPGNGPAAEQAMQGIDHLCLSIECSDINALAAHLKARGIEATEIMTRLGAYGTGPSLYIHDPDGFKVELKPR